MGRFGREFLGVAQLLFIIFFMASHLVTFSVAFNVLTDHGTCTIVFGVVGLIISLICSLPRTLNNVSWLSMASFTSITAAVIICMISLGVQHPGGMPIKAVVQTDLVTAFSAVTNIIFAYSRTNLPQQCQNVLTCNSRSRRLLRYHGRIEGPPRLHQGPLPPASP